MPQLCSIQAAAAAAGRCRCCPRPSPTLHALSPHPQITFPAPVVLTSARVGAAPSAGPAGQRSQLLLFAQDAGAPAAARFVQLCPGFEQPESGSRIVQLQVSGSVQATGCVEVLGHATVNPLHSLALWQRGDGLCSLAAEHPAPPPALPSSPSQPCVTKRVLLRGRYQTVPLTLLGFDLEAAAVAAPPPQQRRISLAGALQWLRQQEQQQAGATPQGEETASGATVGASCMPATPLQPAVEAALAQLVAYWQLVGASERLMALHPPPQHVLKSAAAVADAVCGQLVDGSFEWEPVRAPKAERPQPKSAQQAKQQEGAQQAGAEGQTQHEAEVKAEEPGDAAMPDAEQLPGSPAAQQQAAGAQQQAAQQEQEAQELPASQPTQQALLHGKALLCAATDMVLGWCGLLGAGGAGRTASAMRCSAAGLAAAVLLCSCSEGARLLMARWGAVLLDDVLTMPLVRGGSRGGCILGGLEPD